MYCWLVQGKLSFKIYLVTLAVLLCEVDRGCDVKVVQEVRDVQEDGVPRL
jgi:hypothetical protein